MNYKVAKTIGLNTDQKASQVSFNFCDEENVFLAILTLESDDAFVSGRQLLADLGESFCGGEEAPGEKLTATFAEAKKNLEGKEFSLLLASVSTKVLYLIGVGDIAVMLKRGDSLSPLLEQGTEQLISGFLQDGDKVLVSTHALNSYLGTNLEASLKLPLDEWEDEMAIRLNEEGTESGTLAGLLLEVEQPEVKEESVGDVENNQPKEESFTQLLDSNPTDMGMVGSQTRNLPLKIRGVLSGLVKLLPKSGRIRLIAAVVIILIIIVGVGIKFAGAKGAEDNKKVSALLTQAKSAESEADGLKTLNPGEAQKKLQEASSLIDQALKINPKDKAALDLKNELNQVSSNVLQISQAGVNDFTDLSSIQTGFKGMKMAFSSTNLLVLDSFGSNLVSLNTNSKSAQVLAKKDDLGKAQDVILDQDISYIYSLDKGIVKVDLGNKKASVAIKPDDSWGSINGIGTFGGNLYLLDSDKNQIWKYLPTSSGFSNSRPYFTSDTKADLSGAIDMQIDSSVYVLKQNGTILKFTKGAKADFNISALDKPLKDPKAIFTSADVDNVYVLDSGNSRIVVLDKSGGYKAQYQADKLGIVSSLVVDEKVKKIYTVDGSKVYTMDLK